MNYHIEEITNGLSQFIPMAQKINKNGTILFYWL